MLNGYTFRRNHSVIFIVAFHINWGHLIQERICSQWSKFFPLRGDRLRGDRFLGRLSRPGQQTGNQENCLPLKRCRKKIEVYPAPYVSVIRRHVKPYFCMIPTVKEISAQHLQGQYGPMIFNKTLSSWSTTSNFELNILNLKRKKSDKDYFKTHSSTAASRKNMSSAF